MIRVEIKSEANYPRDKGLILFDRNAFQGLSKDVIHEINKKYNILCPRIFVIECISPENTDRKPENQFERDKRLLLEKVELIENPIVLTGSTNVTDRIYIPPNTEYADILDSWRIARNCIINSPVIMKRIPSQTLVSNCRAKVAMWKREMREATKTIDWGRGSLSPNRYRSHIQRRDEHLHGVTRSMSEIRTELRSDPSTHITQELSNAAGHALREIKEESKQEIIEKFKVHFGLNDEDTALLHDQIRDNRELTMENYPDLSYPIYVHYLIHYMLCGRQQNADHLDSSFYSDFQYLRYLNFCEKFIADETSTPYIVKAIPYSSIRNMCIMTSEKLKESLI